MSKTKYCYNYTEQDYEFVNRLLQRFVSKIEYNGNVIQWKTLQDILNYVGKVKGPVFCYTIEDKYLVADYYRGKVGLSWEIIRQGKMYADFG